MLDQEALNDIKENHMHCSDCFPMEELVATAQAYLDLQDSPGRRINAKASLAASLVASARVAEDAGELEEAEMLFSQARAMWSQ